ncbi:MAG: DNA mismatch repair protein MutS [Carboxydocellales bacterium]
MSKLTPMMQQYLQIKSEYPDAILFFRLGDFYEMFMDDAILASKEMEITLTGRDGGVEAKIPMCGVPYHSVDGYIAKLINKGYKVAICEQVEDPRQAKGIVKREVVRVITPGTVIAHNMLEEKSNNYLLCLARLDNLVGLAVTDISTGLFQVTEISIAQGFGKLLDEISRLKPAEILLEPKLWEDVQFREVLSKNVKRTVSAYKQHAFNEREGETRLCKHLKTQSLDGFGLKGKRAGLKAAGAMLDFLQETQKQGLGHLNRIINYSTEEFMLLDSATRRNLELTATIRDGSNKGSLIWVLDHTVTAMGARLLKNWVEQPLIQVPAIQNRLDATDELFHNQFLREDLRHLCKEIYDLERLTGRISFGNANARDVNALKASLAVLPALKSLLEKVRSTAIKNLAECLDTLEDIHQLLDQAINPEPPFSVREGGLIRTGYHTEVDKLRSATKEGKQWIAGLEAREKERTGIKSLKVGFNKVFGYYIEITKSYYDHVPEDFIRKQTLANAERFITPELKEYESIILGAEDRVVELEYQLFSEIRENISGQSTRLLQTASIIAQLDALASLAEAANKGNYKKPQVRNSDEIHITGGRHPVVEKMLQGEWFVPNDTHLDNEENRLIILTGPNMAGKSTYMRQVALLVLMAQLGSFVPADLAIIGVVDRIFTRVGASDDLATGQSTFMVEMNEVANILNHATEKSLIILDEIGRGTSTFDGLSIAWAVAEYILDRDKIGSKTLFATHYHQLTQLADHHLGVKNWSIAVKEQGEDIIFLRQIISGAADRSYGIQVAKLAGLPTSVIERAIGLLQVLEQQNELDDGIHEAAAAKAEPKLQENQLSFFTETKSHPLVDDLKSLELLNITPIQALNLLYELQKKARG